MSENRYCSSCGQRLQAGASFCSYCGKNVVGVESADAPVYHTRRTSDKSRLVALILCFFLGGIGVHRFYLGKIGTGILWLFTGGLFGIGLLIDFITIACGTATDSDGRQVKEWE